MSVALAVLAAGLLEHCRDACKAVAALRLREMRFALLRLKSSQVLTCQVQANNKDSNDKTRVVIPNNSTKKKQKTQKKQE